MAAFPCVFCGKPIASTEAANELDLVCAACKTAQAIATADDAEKAKVTTAKTDGAIAEGLPPILPPIVAPPKAPTAKPSHWEIYFAIVALLIGATICLLGFAVPLCSSM